MSNQLEELRLKEHLPVAQGFWKVFVQTMAYVVIVLLIVEVWKAPGHVTAAMMTGLVLCAMAVSFRHFLRDVVMYWRRNVRGYNLLCFRNVSGALGLLVLPRSGRAQDQAYVDAALDDEVAIVLPLGGWFSPSWIHIGSRIGDPDHVKFVMEKLAKCKFRIRDIHAHTGAIIIRWRDAGGDRLTMRVEMALERLHECVTSTCPPSMKRTLWDMTNHERNAWHSERERRYEAEAHWTDAVNGLISGARAIAASTRFGRSKDAQRIRRQLANAALAVMSPEDPYRAEAQALALEQVPASAKV